MLLRLQNSLASMREMMRRQEQVANNLANVNTVGYKRDRTFTEALDERLDADGLPHSTRVAAQWADFAQGALDATGNPLDAALEGEGFFVLRDEASGAVRFSRAGRFTRDDQGTLRTPAGYLVEGEAGPITLPPGPVEIDADGTVRAGGVRAGRLRVVTFGDPAVLTRIDDAAFAAPEELAVEAEAPRVRQGMLEGSNVEPMAEMADMIGFFRQFEAQQKMLRSTDELLAAATRDLGKF
ncbi:MAG: flagellar basal-body rod protein FlgF [Rhodothermales bacterium]|nr:flagellar basal-body rod protein FlgF [Rhodothermales bacterium]